MSPNHSQGIIEKFYPMVSLVRRQDLFLSKKKFFLFFLFPLICFVFTKNKSFSFNQLRLIIESFAFSGVFTLISHTLYTYCLLLKFMFKVVKKFRTIEVRKN